MGMNNTFMRCPRWIAQITRPSSIFASFWYVMYIMIRLIPSSFDSMACRMGRRCKVVLSAWVLRAWSSVLEGRYWIAAMPFGHFRLVIAPYHTCKWIMCVRELSHIISFCCSPIILSTKNRILIWFISTCMCVVYQQPHTILYGKIPTNTDLYPLYSAMEIEHLRLE